MLKLRENNTHLCLDPLYSIQKLQGGNHRRIFLQIYLYQNYELRSREGRRYFNAKGRQCIYFKHPRKAFVVGMHPNTNTTKVLGPRYISVDCRR